MGERSDCKSVCARRATTTIAHVGPHLVSVCVCVLVWLMVAKRRRRKEEGRRTWLMETGTGSVNASSSSSNNNSSWPMFSKQFIIFVGGCVFWRDLARKKERRKGKDEISLVTRRDTRSINESELRCDCGQWQNGTVKRKKKLKNIQYRDSVCRLSRAEKGKRKWWHQQEMKKNLRSTSRRASTNDERPTRDSRFPTAQQQQPIVVSLLNRKRPC